jgi:hypothetical protein
MSMALSGFTSAIAGWVKEIPAMARARNWSLFFILIVERVGWKKLAAGVFQGV